jgi:putative transposase
MEGPEVRLLSGMPEGAQGEARKRSRFSEEQIAYALRLTESGTPVVEVCRQIGMSEATFYTWKKKYGELGVSELRKLRQLEDENARLRRIVADLTLDKQILQEVVKKKL